MKPRTKENPRMLKLKLTPRMQRLLAQIAKADPKQLSDNIDAELGESLREVEKKIRSLREEMEGGARPGKRRFHL
jgi:hypothetical protein